MALSKSAKPSRKAQSQKTRWTSWLFFLVVSGGLVFFVYMVYLDAKVRAAFDGSKWTLPAKMYARPMALYPGLLLSEKQLKAELEWSDYHSSAQAYRPGSYTRRGSEWEIFRRAFTYHDGQQPAHKIRIKFANGRIDQLWRDGQEEAFVRLEPMYIGGIFPAKQEDRELIQLQDLPPALVNTLVAVEDRAFYDHFGISPRGIARAIKTNIQSGRMAQGGSTLTQQLVKNYFLSNERTLKRKAQEALMAILLEMHYSKDQILEAYLNEIYFGQAGRRAIHGVALASRFYFAKSVKELEIEEIALLIGIIKGPSFYSPFRHPERAQQRRNVVLQLMQDLNIIDQQQRILAQGKPIMVASARRGGQREYPAFIELVKKQLQQDYRLQDLQHEGLKIYTTLDPWLQDSAERSVQNHLNRLPNNKGLEAAAVITSVDGGEVRAIVGSRNVRYFGFNRALKAKRAIGSLAKPAVYLAALTSGRYQWNSIISDDPVTIGGQDGKVWQPQNYDKKSRGNILMVDGLSQSLNQATTRLGMRVGLGHVIDIFQQLGVQQEIPPYPSILLGTINLTPLEVTEMYQTLASGGFAMSPRSISAVTTANGGVITSYAVEGIQKLDVESVELIRFGMEQVAKRGTAKQLSWTFPDERIAAKTGTTNDQRDAWFVGFDNRHLGVIWAGRDDNGSTNLYGATGALPIWKNIWKDAGVEGLRPLTNLPYYYADPSGHLSKVECGDYQTKLPVVGNPQFVEGCSFLQNIFSDDEIEQIEDKTEEIKEKAKSWLDWLF